MFRPSRFEFGNGFFDFFNTFRFHISDIIIAGSSIEETTMSYGYKKLIKISYPEAIIKIKEALQKEGFGVLTEIDVKATLKKKLGVDYDNYIILGACNPPFAYQALQLEKDIGLLLPCNIIVYESQGQTFVASIRPTVAMNMVNNKELHDVAVQVEAKLKIVIDSI